MQLEPSAIARNTLEGSNFGTFGKLQQRKMERKFLKSKKS